MRASITRCSAAALIAFAPITLVAQNPTAPPVPVINGSIFGSIVTTADLPLSGVNVTLIGEEGNAVTDSAGRYVLRDIKPGGHTVLYRRIGYQSVEQRFMMPSGGNLQIVATMRAGAQQLERIVVEAPGISRKRGTSSIGGRVTDSLERPIPNADVRLLGSGLSSTTDSSGGFLFRNLAAGSYIVRARRQGLAAGSAVMQIADEDDRNISMKLYGLPPKTRAKDIPTASGFGVADLGYAAFDRRVRSRITSVMFGPADMFRADRASMDFMLRQYRDVGARRRRSGSADEGIGSTADGDCLLIDGRRAIYQPLETYSSVRVLVAEVFRANSSIDDFVVSEMHSLKECRGTMDRHPPYFVLWTRSMR